MKMCPRLILGVVVVAVLGGGGLLASNALGSNDSVANSVIVARGSITERALAIGTIEPDVEVTVKSKVSGVLARAFAEEGEYVQAGAPLLEIRPDPTPLELVEAQRAVEMQDLHFQELQREYERQRTLADRGFISRQELEGAQQRFARAEIELRAARERLQLLQSGRIQDSGVESVVRAPISGFILERTVEPGDPVVPLTSYQEGTVLMSMADMGNLVFRGTVDEIDVGRIQEGLTVQITVGALPDARVTGRVSKISLKARKQDNVTTFPVEIVLDPSEDAVLRAGLSANAEVIIDERRDALVIPERVVSFEEEGAWVTVRRADATTERRSIRTGLSDAINIEVLEGLDEGEEVLEKPGRTIQ